MKANIDIHNIKKIVSLKKFFVNVGRSLAMNTQDAMDNNASENIMVNLNSSFLVNVQKVEPLNIVKTSTDCEDMDMILTLSPPEYYY